MDNSQVCKGPLALALWIRHWLYVRRVYDSTEVGKNGTRPWLSVKKEFITVVIMTTMLKQKQAHRISSLNLHIVT